MKVDLGDGPWEYVELPIEAARERLGVRPNQAMEREPRA